MPRLCDRIIDRPLVPPLWLRHPADADFFRKMEQGAREDIRSAQRIVVDNVAEYLYAGTDQEDWDISRDFPNIAPPFPTFWMEYRRPSKIVSRETGVRDGLELPRCTGVLFKATPREEFTKNWDQIKKPGEARDAVIRRLKAEIDAGFEQRGAHMAKLLAEYGPEAGYARLSEGEKHLLAQVKTLKAFMDNDCSIPESLPVEYEWGVSAMSFFDTDSGVVGPVANWTYTISRDGTLAEMPLFGVVGTKHSEVDFDLVGCCNPGIFPCLLALSFMHCKNTHMRSEEPPEKLDRAYRKRHGKPLLRYHVLEIQAVKEVLRSQGRSDTNGLKTALHICRGHFKDYRESGLFGRVKGLFWWDSHVRGTAAEGAVMKDYAVKDKR